MQKSINNCLIIFVLLTIFSSCTFSDSTIESETLTNETINSQDASFHEDFVVEYDKNGMAVLTDYRGDGGNIVIPEGINIIGEHVFDLIYSTDIMVIESVYIPDTVTIISDFAFFCCYYPDLEENVPFSNLGLREIRMSSNIEYIGKKSFCECMYLENIYFDSIPKHTIIIDDQAFAYCESLTSFQLPDSVLLGENVFFNTELDLKYSDKYNTFYPVKDKNDSESILYPTGDIEIVEPIIVYQPPIETNNDIDN